MRAPFNTTCTLYDGPATATPGFPRVVGLPCRLVPDPYFVDVAQPLAQSFAYFTCDLSEPRGAPTLDIGGGVYAVDYPRADRVIFASLPGTTFVVLRVESCTRPNPGAPYFRASIAEDAPPPIACSEGYRNNYYVRNKETGEVNSLERIGSIMWEGSGFNLEAETVWIDPETCQSQWKLTNGSCVWLFEYNGGGDVDLGTAEDCDLDVELLDDEP